MVGEYLGPTEIKIGGMIKPSDIDGQKLSAVKIVEEKIKQFFSNVYSPIKKTKQIYEQERIAGRSVVEQAYKDPGIKKTPIRLALGTLQYVFSPLTAVAKGIVGDPLSEASKAAGIPDKPADFIGKLGEEAVYFVPIGGTIKNIMMRGNEGLKASGQIAKSLKSRPVKIDENVSEIRRNMDKAILPKIETEGGLKDLTKPRIKQGLIDDITDAATQALSGKFDDSQRIFKQIGESLATGEINASGLPEILKKHNLTPVQFAKMYEETISYGGRILGYHSRAKKQLMEIFKNEPEASALLDSAFKKEGQLPYAIDKVIETYGSIENKRRALLVGQVATAVRNAWSQAGRLTLSSIDESLQGAIKGVFGGPQHSFEDVYSGLNNFTALINRMSPNGRKRLFNVLEENNAVLSKMRLFSQPVHEVSLGGKFANAINILNRTQEHFFRRIAFESKLRQLLKRKGINFNTVDPKHIPENMLAESVNYALEMTFAASPKSASVQKLIRAWNDIPGLTTINPFPRFNFANAIPFIYEHSPLGYLSAVKPSTIKKLASGNADEFAKYASRATIGSLMLDSAMRFRQSEHAGERWYEIKISDEKGESKAIDARAFAPFSTYLFIAESVINPDRLKPSDYTQAFIGLNRVAGTGLTVGDWLRANNTESLKEKVQGFAGQYMASFLVPMRTASDIYSSIDKNENVYRDIKEAPLVAPILLNIPKFSQMVPEKFSPVKTGRIYKGEPYKNVPPGILRQTTGLSIRTKTMLEREIDSIGLEYSRLNPRTGVPEADRLMAQYMAPIAEKLAPLLINDNNNYKKLSNPAKRIAISKMFEYIKKQAKKELSEKHPFLMMQIAVEGLSQDERKIYDQIKQSEIGQYIGP